jgi:hypothetical protein
MAEVAAIFRRRWCAFASRSKIAAPPPSSAAASACRSVMDFADVLESSAAFKPQCGLTHAQPHAAPERTGQGREAPVGLGLEAAGLVWPRKRIVINPGVAERPIAGATRRPKKKHPVVRQ